jgi:glucokinase|tara:strand:+ start:34680 stop:35630 length:951 start_codon:yes stop_codon:yes gene_type:complete
MIKHYALGIDIGGTNTAFGVVSQDGEMLFEEIIKTHDYPEAKDMVNDIHKILTERHDIHQILGIGIGAPNGNALDGNIEFAPNLRWKGIIPICELFENKFHKPAILINDANAAAVGELMFGAGRDLKNFVCITLGTGLGSGIIINGTLIEGEHGFAGEFGHIRVVKNGRECGCGRLGCLETYASSTGVVRTYNEWKSELPSDSTIHNVDHISARTIFECAQKGDEFATKIVDFTAEILGSSLADFGCFSDPKAYILFGGLAQSGEFFARKVKAAMEKDILKVLENKIEIRTSELHHRNAAVLGTAATLFWKTIKHA